MALLEAARRGLRVHRRLDVGGARDLHVAGRAGDPGTFALGRAGSGYGSGNSSKPRHRITEHSSASPRRCGSRGGINPSFAAGVPEHACAPCGHASDMQRMTDSYLLAYTMARRRRADPRAWRRPLLRPVHPADAAPLAPRSSVYPPPGAVDRCRARCLPGRGRKRKFPGDGGGIGGSKCARGQGRDHQRLGQEYRQGDRRRGSPATARRVRRQRPRRPRHHR